MTAVVELVLSCREATKVSVLATLAHVVIMIYFITDKCRCLVKYRSGDICLVTMSYDHIL